MERWPAIVFIIVICFRQVKCNKDFGYDEPDDPTHWGDIYEKCLGKQQSPIDISIDKAKWKQMPDVAFTNFKNTPDGATIINNGHTVMIQLKAKKMPKVSHGPLKGTYEFSQMHFHWGRNDQEGSENTLNNERFPLEAHMVFFKNEYRNVSEAVQHPDGLTVLSFLYRVSTENNTHYDTIISTFHDVAEPGKSTSIPKMNDIDALLMPNRTTYFTYSGSLTTPPCSEVVIWIAFESPIPISHQQLLEFRALHAAHGNMTHNFRPTQPLNGRIIYCNKNSLRSGSSVITFNGVLSIIAAISLIIEFLFKFI